MRVKSVRLFEIKEVAWNQQSWRDVKQACRPPGTAEQWPGLYLKSCKVIVYDDGHSSYYREIKSKQAIILINDFTFIYKLFAPWTQGLTPNNSKTVRVTPLFHLCNQRPFYLGHQPAFSNMILCILVGDVPFDGCDKPVEKLWKLMKKVSSREAIKAERYVVSLFQFSHYPSSLQAIVTGFPGLPVALPASTRTR